MNSEIIFNDFYALTGSPDEFVEALEEFCKEYCGINFYFEYSRKDPDNSASIIRITGDTFTSSKDSQERYYDDAAVLSEEMVKYNEFLSRQYL